MSNSHSRSGGFFQEPRSSVTRGEQHVTETALLPSEIEQLPDLHGYLKFASQAKWMKVTLQAGG